MSPCTSSSVSSLSMAALPLGSQGVEARLQWSQARGVGGFDLLAELFGLFLAPLQVVVHLGLVAEVVSQGAVHIRQGKRVQTARDLLRLHPYAPVLQQDVQGDARFADTNGARVVDA